MAHGPVAMWRRRADTAASSHLIVAWKLKLEHLVLEFISTFVAIPPLCVPFFNLFCEPLNPNYSLPGLDYV